MAKVNEFKQDTKNFNQGTPEGTVLMNKSLKEFGAGRSILVDKDDNIIAGNKTALAALNAGIEDAIVVETTGDKLVVVKRTDIDIDSKEGRELALADNKTTEVNLAWDDVQLQQVGEEFGMDLEAWGVQLGEIAEPEEEDPNNTEEDNFDEEEEEIETRVKSGEVWQLGDHRLMCGDSTKAEDVKKLMNGELADLWLTDPPYNVDYSAKNAEVCEAKQTTYIHHEDIDNDTMSDNDFKAFLSDSFTSAKEVIRDGASYYIWTPQGNNQTKFAIALEKMDMAFRQQLIWKKNILILGRQDYQWIHEPCYYGWKPGAAHYFRDIRTETTVIPDADELNIDKMKAADLRKVLHDILDAKVPQSVIYEDKPQRSELHPTMKPVRLFGRLIHNSAKRGDMVLDTFGGSGTTLIACEQLGRKCRMMELDPHYCDVILARWEKLTGKVAVKQESPNP